MKFQDMFENVVRWTPESLVYYKLTQEPLAQVSLKVHWII